MIKSHSQRKDIEELWHLVLGTCCSECMRGNYWDCDVNPLRIVHTPAEAAVMLTRIGEAP